MTDSLSDPRASRRALPDLSGTWQGFIESNWVDPATGRTVPPIPAYYVIRQAGATLRVRLLTATAHSDLLAGRMVREEQETLLSGVYRNEPDAGTTRGSPPHYGAILVHVRGDRLEGTYWTDRGTRGSLRFGRRRPGLARDWEDAQRGG